MINYIDMNLDTFNFTIVRISVSQISNCTFITVQSKQKLLKYL